MEVKIKLEDSVAAHREIRKDMIKQWTAYAVVGLAVGLIRGLRTGR